MMDMRIVSRVVWSLAYKNLAGGERAGWETSHVFIRDNSVEDRIF